MLRIRPTPLQGDNSGGPKMRLLLGLLLAVAFGACSKEDDAATELRALRLEMQKNSEQLRAIERTQRIESWAADSRAYAEETDRLLEEARRQAEERRRNNGY